MSDTINGYSCECCAIAHNNGDISGCVDFHGHGHSGEVGDYDTHPSNVTIDLEPDTGLGYFDCLGCGETNIGDGWLTTIDVD